MIAQELEGHDYLDESVDEFALVYVAGYTARKSQKFTDGCPDCAAALKLQDSTKATDDHMLIKLKSKGYLTYPSDQMVTLLRHLETHVVETSKKNELEENILFLVVENLEKCSNHMPLVGCHREDHQKSLTKAISKFFLIMRMHFLCRRWNQVTAEQKKKIRIHKKLAHQT